MTFKFINLWQTNEERQQKYWLCRSLGANYSVAMRMRDWRLCNIEQYFGITETFNSHTKAYDRDLSQSPMRLIV